MDNEHAQNKTHDSAAPMASISRRLMIVSALIAKWILLAGLVIFGSITAVGTLGLDPFWSSLIGLAIAFGVIVWHMPKRGR